MNEELIKRLNLLPRVQAISTGDSVFNAEQRQLIAEVYKDLLGKEIPNCSCRHRYSDALEEICLKFKIKITSTMKCKYQLKAGVIIWIGTDCYSNHNLTDEIAEQYLAKFPEAKEKEFQAWPEETPEPEPEHEPEPEPEPANEEGEGDKDPEPQPEADPEPVEEKKPKSKKGK